MAAFDEKDYTRSFDWSIWKRLTPFVRPFRRDFVGMLVFNGLCALVDVAIPLFQRYAIRNFIQADSLFIFLCISQIIQQFLCFLFVIYIFQAALCIGKITSYCPFGSHKSVS